MYTLSKYNTVSNIVNNVIETQYNASSYASALLWFNENKDILGLSGTLDSNIHNRKIILFCAGPNHKPTLLVNTKTGVLFVELSESNNIIYDIGSEYSQSGKDRYNGYDVIDTNSALNTITIYNRVTNDRQTLALSELKYFSGSKLTSDESFGVQIN